MGHLTKVGRQLESESKCNTFGFLPALNALKARKVRVTINNGGGHSKRVLYVCVCCIEFPCTCHTSVVAELEVLDG